MKILRFDSIGGASGDMILGALISLYDKNPDELNKQLKSLLPKEKFKIETETVHEQYLNGVRTKIILGDTHDKKHVHRNFANIKQLIDGSKLPGKVKSLSIEVFARLAAAEAQVHGVTPDEIHFHEVGAVDSILDIVGCCYLLVKLKIDRVYFSPLPLGKGSIKCQHGIIPLPVPATVELLKGFPVIQTDEPFELVTPTAAALLTTWNCTETLSHANTIIKDVNSFGHRKLSLRPNLLRVLLLESITASESSQYDNCFVLESNIDDSTPEIIGYVTEKLFSAGARDVFTTPVQMKKQRPGIMLTVICTENKKAKLQEIIFRETSTFGIREFPVSRKILDRTIEEVSTPYGKVKVKIGQLNGQVVTRSPEMDNCIELAEKHNVPVQQIYESAINSLNSSHNAL